MKNTAQEIAEELHFDCPKCGRPMVGDPALIHELICCPDCATPFQPRPRFSPALSAAGPARSGPAPPEHFAARSTLEKRRSEIRFQAAAFSFVSGLCVVAGAGGLLLAILVGSVTAGFVAASAFGLALWLYLISQVIHIRASLEK